MKLSTYLLLILITTLCITACKEEDLPPSQGMLYLTLKGQTEMSADNISIKGHGIDSMIYDSVSSETFLLPMPLSDDIFKYQINFNRDSTDAETDLLEVYTTKTENFNDYSEGVYYVYTIDSFKFTTNAVDSAYFIYNIVDQKQYENIRLYYSIDTTTL
ncbi:MAG: DUF6452 family protein [Bacteroidales bacterium]